MTNFKIAYIDMDPTSYYEMLPGEGRYYGEVNIEGLYFVCPGPCNNTHGISFSNWHWDGNKEKPSVTPSILCGCDGCNWHGYLTDGIWKSVNE